MILGTKTTSLVELKRAFVDAALAAIKKDNGYSDQEMSKIKDAFDDMIPYQFESISISPEDDAVTVMEQSDDNGGVWSEGCLSCCISDENTCEKLYFSEVKPDEDLSVYLRLTTQSKFREE